MFGCLNSDWNRSYPRETEHKTDTKSSRKCRLGTTWSLCVSERTCSIPKFVFCLRDLLWKFYHPCKKICIKTQTFIPKSINRWMKYNRYVLSDLRECCELQQWFSCNQIPSSSSNSQNLQFPSRIIPQKQRSNMNKQKQKLKEDETRLFFFSFKKVAEKMRNLHGAINGVSCRKPLIRLFAESRHRNRQIPYLRLNPFLVNETFLHSSVHRLHKQIRRSRRVSDRLLPRSLCFHLFLCESHFLFSITIGKS